VEYLRERPQEAIRYTTQIFDSLWRQKEQIGAEPIPLPVISSYGFPIKVGLRYVTHDYSSIGPCYMYGLFEDRREFPFANGCEDHTNSFISSLIEPVGWIVLEKTNNPNKLLSFTSLPIGRGERISDTSVSEDPFFCTFSKKATTDSITVGFRETLLTRRQRALAKLPSEIREEFRCYSKPQLCLSHDEMRRFSALNQRLNNHKGLGTTLLDLAILLASKAKYEFIELRACSKELQNLVSNYQCLRTVDIDMYERSRTDFIIHIPHD
jgi:hypothetical protein